MQCKDCEFFVVNDIQQLPTGGDASVSGLCHGEAPKLFMVPVQAKRSLVANESPGASISIMGARPQVAAEDQACRGFLKRIPEPYPGDGRFS